MKSSPILFVIVIMLNACTWVNENQAGRNVFIVPKSQVTNCQKAGNIKAEVKHKIGFIKRRASKILEELQILARNEALNLGANTIVAKHQKPIEGKKSYAAFICPR